MIQTSTSRSLGALSAIVTATRLSESCRLARNAPGPRYRSKEEMKKRENLQFDLDSAASFPAGHREVLRPAQSCWSRSEVRRCRYETAALAAKPWLLWVLYINFGVISVAMGGGESQWQNDDINVEGDREAIALELKTREVKVKTMWGNLVRR